MRFFLLSCLALLTFASCQTETANGINTTGMPTLDSGYAYDLFTDAEGNVPEQGELVIFDLQQRFDDTLVYDSKARGRSEQLVIPNPSRLTGNPSPVIEMLRKMSVGDSARIYIPVDSLGSNVQPQHKDKDYLIYQIGVNEIKNLKEKENKAATTTADLRAAYQAGTLEGIQETPEGLKYKIIENGSGDKAERGKVINVDYYGVTAEEGTMFDNSFGRGQMYRFPLGAGRVIKGWDIGLEGMNAGTKAVLFIPSHLAYGKAGSPPKIGPDAELIFYVEVGEIE